MKTVTATATKSKAKHKIRHMMIEPNTGNKTFTAETHFEPPAMSEQDMSRGMMPPMPPEPVKHGFENADDLAKHVSKTFGGSMHKASAGPKTPAKAEVESQNPKEEAAEEANEDEG